MAGLYIHIPFCRRKCLYCDFVSGSASEDDQLAYLVALSEELNLLAPRPEVAGLGFDTLYVGGGTPTVVPAVRLAYLLEQALKKFSWVGSPEITVEANPESVTEEGLSLLKAVGVNRLSIGLQALSDGGLKALGRGHRVSEGLVAVEIARKVGFAALSVDLIYGWPGQDIAEWRTTLEGVVDLGPEHLSAYELTPEEGTPLAEAVASGERSLPSDEMVLALTDLAEDFLEGCGYEHYEISNFAKGGFRCRHNLNYWHNGPYLGLGAAAVSYLPPQRLQNERDRRLYMDRVLSGRPAWSDSDTLGPEARFRESVVLGLRLADGISSSDISRHWGFDPLNYYGRSLKSLTQEGLLCMHGDRVCLTRRGRRFSNRVFRELV